MDFVKERPGLSVLIAFIVGLIIGQTLFGWYLFPVEWTGAGPADLDPAERDVYLQTIADAYSYQPGNTGMVTNALRSWPTAGEAICELRGRTADPAAQQRLDAIAMVQTGGQSCGAVSVDGTLPEVPAAAEENSNLGTILALLLVLALVGAGIVVVLNRRNSMMAEDDDVDTYYDNMPESAPTSSEEGVSAVPIARFQSDYVYGRDNYDDSFSIENSGGEFLGECGVGIAESIGSDTPKNVTALEVWLFDKNDIRTITKVVMSDHAFFDEALKAKLAPKGEPVLARENEVIVLETATLIINAEIKEMQYGAGAMPPQSYFENFSIELSAWAKESDYDESDRVDEMLEY
ncbi:MAG: hypothetical protein H6654_14780 [Ardenticatenaceae bacterium]|nr:hypothetical protein [Anaerolineales bacterium]MCB8939065.1 hypothetical protein [Ardenticatenaceae bacterium]MCB8974821.1 hypothetical protein [Ardenticatenaceae bacterium]